MQRKNTVKEMDILLQLSHPNIVQYLGFHELKQVGHQHDVLFVQLLATFATI